ncbi:hypothetical protein EI77_00226 [Prosthecobacter fusiformis]|uniref:Uncharacterized protein n=2 Tax=Prosthecobacter fusiformis TaxID=48464 RepID=A0A4R7SQI3_9BACT|nr:hypothetical protein EI77_00226 [Prosthecobacter fusiformis]
MLLTAPRAGYGKTHLLGRVVAAAGSGVVMVPLAFRTGDVLNLTTVTRRGLEALSLAAGDTEDWSRLREACAGLVAHLLHELIKEGLVPSANPEQALRVLTGPVTDVFNKDGAAHMIGDWLRKHAGGLRPILARRVARQVPVRADVADAWLDAMLGQAFEGGAEGVAVMQDLAAADRETGTPTWLRMLSLWRPVVLLVDHLDGYYRNPDAGVTIASLLMDMVDSQGLHVLLSLNQDVWQATFGHHLPSALEDRLTATQVLLRGLRETDAAALMRLRMDRAKISKEDLVEFEAFVDVKQYFLGRPIGSVSARVFLRHCARQWEIFQNSVPLSVPGEQAEVPSAGISFPPLPVEPSSTIPLMTETLPLESADEVPPIFDETTSAEVQQMAESLAEPQAALPQNDPPPPPAASDWRATTAEAGAGTPVPPVSPSSDAFVKLREMLHHLRQPGARNQMADDAADIPAERLNIPSTPAAPPAAAPAKPKTSPIPVSRPGDALLGRFETLRLQMKAEAENQPLDYAKLGELIRLAGRRFPLVRLGEHELLGMTGRQTMVWSIQGVELLFGLAPFTDTAYWRVLAGFAAGRLVDLASEAERDDTPPVKLKVVTFKADREHAAWQALYSGDTMPDPLKPHLDAVHLDTHSVAALYAMQRIIKDAETGAVQAEPTQVMTVLARELDFFWKRITRA